MSNLSPVAKVIDSVFLVYMYGKESPLLLIRIGLLFTVSPCTYALQEDNVVMEMLGLDRPIAEHFKIVAEQLVKLETRLATTERELKEAQLEKCLAESRLAAKETNLTELHTRCNKFLVEKLDAEKLLVKAEISAATAEETAVPIRVDLALMAALAATIYPDCIDEPDDPHGSPIYYVWPGRIPPDILDKMENAKVRYHMISVSLRNLLESTVSGSACMS